MNEWESSVKGKNHSKDCWVHFVWLFLQMHVDLFNGKWIEVKCVLGVCSQQVRYVHILVQWFETTSNIKYILIFLKWPLCYFCILPGTVNSQHWTLNINKNENEDGNGSHWLCYIKHSNENGNDNNEENKNSAELFCVKIKLRFVDVIKLKWRSNIWHMATK